MTYRCIVSHTTLSEVLKVPIILLHSSITTDSVSRLYRLSYDMIAYTNAKRYQSLFIHMCVQAEHVVDHGHKICTFQTTVFYAIVIVFSVFFWGGGVISSDVLFHFFPLSTSPSLTVATRSCTGIRHLKK